MTEQLQSPDFQLEEDKLNPVNDELPDRLVELVKASQNFTDIDIEEAKAFGLAVLYAYEAEVEINEVLFPASRAALSAAQRLFINRTQKITSIPHPQNSSVIDAIHFTSTVPGFFVESRETAEFDVYQTKLIKGIPGIN